MFNDMFARYGAEDDPRLIAWLRRKQGLPVDESVGAMPALMRSQPVMDNPSVGPQFETPALTRVDTPVQPTLSAPLTPQDIEAVGAPPVNPLVRQRMINPDTLPPTDYQNNSQLIRYDPQGSNGLNTTNVPEQVVRGRVAGDLPPLERPADSYSSGFESRPKEVNPVDPLTRLIDYRKQQEDVPAKTVSWWRALLGGLASGGVFGAAGALTNRKAIGEALKRRELARTDADIKQQEDILDSQVNRDYKQAAIPYMLARPDLERDKLTQKSAYDEWRMKSGNRKQDTYESWLQWRRESGDRAAHSLDEYRDWQMQSGDRRLDEAERHNKSSEEIARQNSELSARRTAAYEYAVRNGGVGKPAQIAADTAEADFWDSEADDAEARANEMDKATTQLGSDKDGVKVGMNNETYDEVQRLRRQAQQYRQKAALKKARIGARSSTPSGDPLGLYSK